MGNDHFVLRQACPACRSKDIRELYTSNFTVPPISDYLEDFYSAQGGVEFEYLEGVNYTLDECGDCGLIYQRWVPDDFLMMKLYGEWIDADRVFNLKVKNREVGFYEHLAREVGMTIHYFQSKPSQLEYFDFGMGWGDWCRMARAYGCSVFGTELSQVRVNYARASGIPVIDWEQVPQHRFDLINTEQVFEHLTDPLGTFQYLCRSLKPSGIIKISVPDGWDIKRRLARMDWRAPKGSQNSLNPVAPLEHINCFTHNSLVQMVRIVGFSPIEIRDQTSAHVSLLDLSLRKLIRPVYRSLMRLRSDRSSEGSTYLFLARSG